MCMKGIGKSFQLKTRIFPLNLNSQQLFKPPIFHGFKIKFWSIFSRHVLPMRYNAELPEIYVVISGNVLLFKDVKISLGLLIAARKMYARIRKIATSRCQQIVSAVEPNIKCRS